MAFAIRDNWPVLEGWDFFWQIVVANPEAVAWYHRIPLKQFRLVIYYNLIQNIIPYQAMEKPNSDIKSVKVQMWYSVVF